MYRMAYRILIPLLVLCLLLVSGLLVLERTGLIEIDEKAIQPEVVSCQVGHNDMKVRVQGGNGATYRGEVVPRYKLWLPVRRVRRLLLGQAQSGIAHSPTPIGKDIHDLGCELPRIPRMRTSP
jgi:hypothetical protein